MIETIAVLAILGLVAALVVGRGRVHSPAVDVRSAAVRVLQGLRFARAQAIATDTVQRFTVLADPPGFQVGTRAAQALPREVTASIEIAGKPAPALAFAPDGSASGGSVVLAEAGRRLAVEVNWLSGRVSLAAPADPAQ